MTTTTTTTPRQTSFVGFNDSLRVTKQQKFNIAFPAPLRDVPGIQNGRTTNTSGFLSIPT